jgi:hypothetical protein
MRRILNTLKRVSQSTSKAGSTAREPRRCVPRGDSLECRASLSSLVQIDLTKYVNSNLQTYTNGTLYPKGGTQVTVQSVPFTLASNHGMGTWVIQAPQSKVSSFDVKVSVANPSTVYTLINSTFGALGKTVGSVEFKATGGLDYTVNLVEGQDIRDHNRFVYNNVIGQGTLGRIYMGTASYAGGQVRLDEQAFALPAGFRSATLTDVILHGSGNYPNGNPFLAAVTVLKT